MNLLVSQPNDKIMPFIYFMYGGLILFFIYKQFKGYKERQKIQGQKIKEFKKDINKFTYILGVLIIGLGIFNIVNKQYLSGILMIALVLVLIIDSFDKVIVSNMGIYGQSKYLPWNQIKKWAFDLDSSDLVLTYKEDIQDQTHYIRVDRSSIEELNMIIRKFKLGK